MALLRKIPRAEHNISRNAISALALDVLYGLKNAGFDAYLVGGGVRDLLLNLHPKDFDVATNAHPEQVRKLFPNSRLIGKRFRIVHVYRGRQIIEVTTFRKGAALDEEDEHKHKINEHGMVLRDNIYGSIEEDALRRDFTVNALYYNIADFSIADYVGGMEDLTHKCVRLIGEPDVRFREDPVRMLRALRFAGKLDFKLDTAITNAIPKMKHLLQHIVRSRLFDEFIKILTSGKSYQTIEKMLQYNLLDALLPSIPHEWEKNAQAEALAKKALLNTDERVRQEKSINPAFMLSVLYWHILWENKITLENAGQSKAIAYELAINETIHTILKDVSAPQRFLGVVRDIWGLQRRFAAHPSKRLFAILELTKFRAGYDFLLLRAELDPSLKPLADWWTQFYEARAEDREALLSIKPDAKKNTATKKVPNNKLSETRET